MYRWLSNVSYLPFFQAETGTGTGGGAGVKPNGTGSGQAEDTQKEQEAPKWAQDMVAGIQAMTTHMQGITNFLTQSGQGREQPEDRQPQPDNEQPSYSAQELETMPRQQFGQLLAEQILGEVQKMLEPIGQAVQGVGARTVKGEVQREIEKLVGDPKTADYWEWKDDMLRLAQESPGLSPTRYYHLARAENPEKVDQVDKKLKRGKYAEAQQPAGQNGERPRFFSSFGGLAPAGASGGSTGAPKKMSTKEASSAAWEALVEVLGGEPKFEE